MSLVFPHVEPGDEVRVSASTYVTWKKCPQSANARLQGVFGPDSRPSFTGILAHRIFARHLSDGPISSDHFVQACREEIGNSTLNMKLGSLQLKPSALAGIIQEVQALYDRFVRIPEDGFEGAEVDLTYESGSGVTLVGTVDAVYQEDLGGHRLVDWKTGELADVDDQLLFYATLWALGRSELPARVEAVSVRTAERTTAVPSRSDVERVMGEIAQLVDEVRKAWSANSDLERRGGPWCQYCPILSDCPEGRSTRALLG